MNIRTAMRVWLGFAVVTSFHSLRAAPCEDFALHCPYVSSAPSTYGWDKPGLTDGVWGFDAATCYATNGSPTFPKTVTVDLQSVRPITTVVLGVPPFGSTKTVKISVSVDDAEFSPFGTHVFEQGDAQRAVVTNTRGEARYVRLTYEDHYATTRVLPPDFVFTSELEVYDGPAPPAPDLSLLAITPTIKDPEKHVEFMDRIAAAPVGLLFLGDSIIDNWPRRGEPSWLKFAPLEPANFGVSSDRTEHLLWRIKNGELDHIHPKVVVILIGTNNALRDQPRWTAAGITKIVETVRTKLPQSKILLLGIFPRDHSDSLQRQKNSAVNAIISQLDDGNSVQYLDLGKAFLDDKGEIPPDIMPDGLHPSAKGYEIWYQAMFPKLEEMLR